MAGRFRDIGDRVRECGGGGPAILAEDGAGAAVRGQQPCEHANGGGLAGAVVSQESEDGALGHRQAEALDGGLAAEALAQRACFNDGFHQRFSLGLRGPLTAANSSSTRRRISSGARTLATASRRAWRMWPRTTSRRRALQAPRPAWAPSLPPPPLARPPPA